MAFHEAYRQQFVQKASLPTPLSAAEAPTAAVAPYEVRLIRAQVAAGQPQWRLIGVHHLTPDENRGGHSVYVDVVDETGKALRDPSLQLRWGWEGQRAGEASPPKRFDKPANEPGANVELYLGQLLWVEVEGGGLPSDRVANLHSKHADERGPQGELWNSIGHHSFYLVFQRTGVAGASQPTATPVVATPEKPETPPAPAPAVEAPHPAPPPAPAKVNRLGFYLHLSLDQDGLWEAIRQVQPPVILIHADSANRLLLREIRQFRAPDAFVVARLYKDNATQSALLNSGDPAARGREMADEILALDFGLATERGANGRRLIDAWMSLNEAVPGPASHQFAERPAETSQMLRAYDLFQSAFHERLQEAGVEAVAFNFGAGNFSHPDHYLQHFPNTLARYTYLGFHEYGWPTLHPAPGSATSAGLYRACMEGIRARYGTHHRAIITEAGLTRMFQNPAWGDVGWLNPDQPLSQEAYWQTLEWYNRFLAEDDYVLGACLYEVGHHGDWATFRHLGRDHEDRPLELMQRIAALDWGRRGARRRRRDGIGASQRGQRSAVRDFVRVQAGEFVADGRPLRFIGVNVRGIVHYGDERTLPYTTRDHAREQIRAARAMGARVMRVFLPSVHADTATTIERLAALLEVVRAEAPDLYVLPALCNLYQDVELRVPGDDGFYERIDPNFGGNLLNAAFFGGGYRTNYLPFVQQVVQTFRDEPLIFAWEIGNELKLNPVSGDLERDPNIAIFLDFMLAMAREIRRLDPNHLITTGMISTHHAWLHTPTLRKKLYGGAEFDFITVHCYNDERQNDDSDLARELGKPFIVEEAGYGLQYGSDRSPKSSEDMAIWFGKGSRGYMPWGFMATNQDIGDGDRDSGLDRTLHGDWEKLFNLFRSRAEALVEEAARIVLPPPTPVEPGPGSTPVLEGPLGAFQQNQTVYSTDWLNIRRTPGYMNKLGDDILGLFAPAQPAVITGAAVEQDGLTWWPVRVTLDGGLLVDGWAAEANATMRLLSAQAVRPRGAAGIAARQRGRGVRRGQARRGIEVLYTTTYVNLRHSPGYVGKGSDDLLGQIPYGAQVQVTGEATTADELSWRPVRAPLLDNSVASGWAAEVDPNGMALLSATPPAAPVTNVGGVIGAPFAAGAEVTLLGVANLLPAVSLSTKAALAVASLLPNAKLTVVGGPELRGDLEWWQVVQGACGNSTRAGWAALTTEEGMRLLAASGVAEAIHVALPFAERWPITQGWGGNAQIYSTIPYDGVPLKGHNGLDFGTPVNTPLLACDGGKVQRVDYEHGGFGHFVLLQHSWGESLYAHLERVDVAQGVTVGRGQQLGLSGNSGFSSGPHLHFGIRITPYRRTDGWGGFVNPTPFMRLEDFLTGRAPASVDRWTALAGWVRP
jgi:murein DD-endopeptidase MepM/ murein hydrolase activator NlpD